MRANDEITYNNFKKELAVLLSMVDAIPKAQVAIFLEEIDFLKENGFRRDVRRISIIMIYAYYVYEYLYRPFVVSWELCTEISVGELHKMGCKQAAVQATRSVDILG